MKIRQLQLKNFKRFTDLTIDLSSTEPLPKLVLLIGANGCGKSSVFDAFEILNHINKTTKTDNSKRTDYYVKQNGEAKVSAIFEKNLAITAQIENEDNVINTFKKGKFPTNAFYGRSAVRYLPRLIRTSLGQAIDIQSDKDRPIYFIDPDNRFENDVEILLKNIIDIIFKGINQSNPEQLDNIKAFLNRINEALTRIFGFDKGTSLRFVNFLPPSDGQPILMLFRKGTSEINYDLLSSGEKEIINILFNLFLRTPIHQDTIYFFDEMDSHLHTSLQYNLLAEIVENWLPDNCQLWTASHSLGFIRYAQNSPQAAIIDFDNLDFDQKVALTPQKGQEIFDIAVPKDALEVLFRDKIKVFCEGQNASIFNSMLWEKTLFLGESDKSSVFLRSAEKGGIGLIDRDYLSDAEKKRLEMKFPQLVILDYYCFENYVYHPDNLKEAYPNLDKKGYINAIVAEKNRLKNDIISKIRNDRNSYIFFKRTDYKVQDVGLESLFQLLESDEFDDFYKVFSMKGKGNLAQLHNLKSENLVKTKWFKAQMIEVFKNASIGII
jgi:AAA15 family ATPase/GTPase